MQLIEGMIYKAVVEVTGAKDFGIFTYYILLEIQDDFLKNLDENMLELWGSKEFDGKDIWCNLVSFEPVVGGPGWESINDFRNPIAILRDINQFIAERSKKIPLATLDVMEHNARHPEP